MRNLGSTRVALSVLGVLALLAEGCAKEGCLGGDEGCVVPSPCPKVAFTCDAAALGSQLAVKTLASGAERLGGWDALGSTGDVQLSNAFATVVIAGLGHQNYLDPNGGSILDLAPAGQASDSVNNIFQVVGVLPAESAHYQSLTVIDERPTRVAVLVKGTLDGRPAVKVYTRYELTPCDPGVRVRTEIINGGTDTELWSLVDGYYWSGREALPFAPGVFTKDGHSYSGFGNPSFSLLSINDVFRPMPYLAAAGHSGDEKVSSIASAMCTADVMEGFNSDQVSAAGLKRAVVPVRGYEVFERFLAVADSKGVSGAVDVALEVRRQVLGEALVTVTGKVERVGASALDSERQASVLIAEGTLSTPEAERNQWTQVVPEADGSFLARVPAGKSYVVEVHAFGRKQIEREFATLASDTPLGTFVLPSTATVTFEVKDPVAQGLDAEIFVVPFDDAERAKVSGSFHGRFTTCSPWLGAPPGASPACNRVLVRGGTATADVPVGKYYVYAFHGPFWSLGREVRTVAAEPSTIAFTLSRLPLQPAGTVSADLHVHGAASFDSSIPDHDRVLSFSASDLDVIIASDHDVVGDYAKVIEALGFQGHMTAVNAVETTGHIPFLTIPNYGFPLVIGHYNLWPIKFDPSLPRNGGPSDELVEPGTLFERTKPLFTAKSLIELNHPWADPEFGRDLGFPRALALDTTKDLPAGDTDDGTSGGLYVRTPPGSSFTNDAHHAQEVMNGTSNGLFLQYRAFWHFVLNQGRLKAGTANSDSHSLTDNTVGLPRNVVYTSTRAGPAFDVEAFNQAVRDGRLIGTNGPLVEASLEDSQGTAQAPSLEPFAPKADAAVKVKVSSAPWVPVEEVRFLVNGQVVKTVGPLPPPEDPLATAGDLTRYQGEVSLAELVAGVTGDAWVVIEAGRRLPLFGDLGGGLNGTKDGIPDTTDNNGDGVVDARDVGVGLKVGPLLDLPAPALGEAGFDYYNITQGHPAGFTNPFVLDRDGDGKFTAPGAKGGRP